MSQRYYKKDVEVMLGRVIRAAEAVGITLEPGWEYDLQVGSQTYGRAWRLYKKAPDSGALHRTDICDDYLGWTAREAYQHLYGLAQGMEAAGRTVALLLDTARDLAGGALDFASGGEAKRIEKIKNDLEAMATQIIASKSP
jgi:hypothetical protein